MLEFTVWRMHRFDGEGSLRAFCDVCVSEQLLIKGFKVMEGKEGLFVSMPSEVGKDGKWYKLVMTLSPEVKDKLNEVVLSAYHEPAEVKV